MRFRPVLGDAGIRYVLPGLDGRVAWVYVAYSFRPTERLFQETWTMQGIFEGEYADISEGLPKYQVCSA